MPDFPQKEKKIREFPMQINHDDGIRQQLRILMN